MKQARSSAPVPLLPGPDPWPSLERALLRESWSLLVQTLTLPPPLTHPWSRGAHYHQDAHPFC